MVLDETTEPSLARRQELAKDFGGQQYFQAISKWFYRRAKERERLQKQDTQEEQDASHQCVPFPPAHPAHSCEYSPFAASSPVAVVACGH